MKIQTIFLAGHMGLTLGTVNAQTPTKTVDQATCQKKEKGVLLPLLQKAAAMVVCGSASFYLGDVAIEGFSRLIPKEDPYKGLAGKSIFPVMGAFGFWLWCHYVKNANEATQNTVPCMGTCC